MYEKLLDLNNLHRAFTNCKKQVTWKSSVQRYEYNELANINDLRKKLRDHTYRQKPFYEFDINERGKRRHIKSLHISDRVLQRALCDEILSPALEKYLIYDNGASQKGKGIEFTRQRLKAHLEKYYRQYGREGYILSIDYSKYFDNIDHAKLLKMIGSKINDGEVMQLLQHLVDTFNTPEHEGKSCGIGSQVSQVAGIFYPTPIDSYCKIVKGEKYYGRYMDDSYIMSPSKKHLRELLEELRGKCAELGIIINEKKTQLIKISNGFTFLKMHYFFTETGHIVITPCRKTITRERRKLRKLRERMDAGKITREEIREQYKSWRGNIAKYNSYKTVQSMDALYKSLFEG